MNQYEVKVRGRMYLWGSHGVTVNLAWPMLLTFRVDIFGEPITFGTETATSQDNPKTFGQLQPGESYTIPLQGLSGVFANCDLDSLVHCMLIAPQVAPVAS
jgi:hypothetical protein